MLLVERWELDLLRFDIQNYLDAGALSVMRGFADL
jgi:hypothetical protein